MLGNSKALGRAIRTIRRAHGLSGMQFALRLGVSIDTLRSWEIGRNQPDAENTLKLADLAPPELTWKLLGQIGVTPARVRRWLARAGRPARRSRAR